MLFIHVVVCSIFMLVPLCYRFCCVFFLSGLWKVMGKGLAVCLCTFNAVLNQCRLLTCKNAGHLTTVLLWFWSCFFSITYQYITLLIYSVVIHSVCSQYYALENAVRAIVLCCWVQRLFLDESHLFGYTLKNGFFEPLNRIPTITYNNGVAFLLT